MMYLMYQAGNFRKSRFSKTIYSSQTLWGVFVLGVLGLNLTISGTNPANLNNLVLGGPDINLQDSLTAEISPRDNHSKTGAGLNHPENSKSDSLSQTFKTAITAKKTVAPKNDPPSKLVIPTLGWNWGILHSHNAVDIANGCGTPVYAAYEGFITKNLDNNEWNDGYGNYLEIEHPIGLSTLYAHLEKTVVQVGQYVKTKGLVGYMGNTGNTHGPTGCHLHFEVHNGRNPFATR